MQGLKGRFDVHSMLTSEVVENKTKQNKTKQNKTKQQNKTLTLARSNIHLLVLENGAEKENPKQKVEAEKVFKNI